MRNVLIVILLFPFVSLAQHEYTFTNPPSSKSRLLQLGDHTIFIEPLDVINQHQKWITFDSSLNIIATKKLVTPGAFNLIQQNYLQGENAIIRIDQSYNKGYLLLSVFTFDVKGNLLHANDLTAKTGEKNGIMAAPFFIAQSPDKRSFVLIQSQQGLKDSMTIAAIVFDDTLSIKTNAIFTVPYNAEMYDVHAPIIGNDGTVFIPVVDKFNSYKLSADLKIFSLVKGSQAPFIKEIEFDRKKIKNLLFKPAQDTLFVTTLFSNSKEDKEDVTGVLMGNILINSKDEPALQEYLYTSEVKQQLKKMFGGENRKGSLLNYISIMPGAFINNGEFNHAVLLPQQNNIKPQASKNGTPSHGDMVVVKKVLYTTTSIVAQPLGYSRPLTTQVQTQSTGNLYSVSSTSLSGSSNIEKQLSAPGRRTIPTSRNLLYYSFTSEGEKENRFLRLKPVADARHSFFTYYNNTNGYGVLHYFEPTIKQPFLNSVFINNDGLLEEKKIFEDKSKIIPAGYDYVVNNSTLIAFYVDKVTGSVGLIKLKL